MSSKSYSAAFDQRTQFASGSGVQVAPGAAVASPSGGAVNAAAGSSVSQTVTSTGFVADDVAQLLGMIEADRADERQAFTDIGENLAENVAQQAAQTSSILAATKTPDATALSQLLPLAVLAVVAYILLR